MEKGIEIIKNNINLYINNANNNLTKRKMYLSDFTKILKEDITSNLGCDDIFESICKNESVKKIFDDNLKNLYSGLEFTEYEKEVLKYDVLFICSELIKDNVKGKTISDIAYYLTDENEIETEQSENIISYVRSVSSNKATEIFAKTLGKITLSPKDNYSQLIEDISNGDISYAVFPVENSNDGRLSSFRNLIERQGLYTILSCSIENERDEKTQFDLVSQKMKIPVKMDNPMFRFRITLNDMNELGTMLSLLEETNTKIYRLFSLTNFDIGRDNSFDIICQIKDSDFPLLITILKLFYPQFVFSGLFDLKEG